jgi:hypothetical protein
VIKIHLRSLKHRIPRPDLIFGTNGAMSQSDLRIVPLGSGGVILDLDMFLKYRDIKLDRQVSEIERKDNKLAHSEY